MKPMGKLYIGATLMLAPFAPDKFELGKANAAGIDLRRPCTVIYINRPHRFFRVRFASLNGSSFTESFKFMLPSDVAQKPLFEPRPRILYEE